MGLSARMPEKNDSGPGPGSYNIGERDSSRNSLNTSQATIGKSKRETVFQTLCNVMSMTPGPACYSGPATPRKILGGVIGTGEKY